METVITLGFMDLNSAAESVTLSSGITFSGAVEPQKVQIACNKLSNAWPILGAHLRRSETGKIEAVIPNEANSALKVTTLAINGTLAKNEKIYVQTKTISTQYISRNESFYRPQPLQNLEAYVSRGDPAFALHVTYLSDATIFTLTIAHILMDASGLTEVIKGFILALDGKPIPPLLSHDPWSVILPEALGSPSNPEASRGWAVWDADSGLASRRAEEKDMQADGPIQSRTIYFPAAEIARLKQEAIEELKRGGYEVPILSTTDIVGAWLYKHTFIDTPDSEEKSRFIYVVDARNRFPEAFPPGQAYLHNAFFNMSTEPINDSKLHSMSLGEIARMIRLSVKKYTARGPLLSQLKWKHEHAGQTQIPFSPGDRIQFASSWLSFRLGDLSIDKHIVPELGQVVCWTSYTTLMGVPAVRPLSSLRT
ncbi:Transferase domain-containing protein [Ceratobasidium sp. AG-Ba]|nr:Transferase domain-containing protein [Ceratobasidium sp. AG-Ba]